MVNFSCHHILISKIRHNGGRVGGGGVSRKTSYILMLQKLHGIKCGSLDHFA